MSDENGFDERLVTIESKVAFNEDLLETLNTLVAKQQLAMDMMGLRVDKLSEILQSVLESGGQFSGDATDETPPHY